MKIAIDAGHGPATLGKRTPNFPDGTCMHEYEFNADTARRVIELLGLYKDVQILATFEDGRDVPLQERTDKANAWKADVFVSIHANASGEGGWNDARGIETYVYTSKPTGAVKLAAAIQQRLLMETGLSNRGVKSENFHVLRETHMTAILCECGFMTNHREAELLKSDAYRQKCATAIVDGIVEIYRFIKKSLEGTQPEPNPPQPDWQAEGLKWLQDTLDVDKSWKPTDPLSAGALGEILRRYDENKGK